MPSIRGSAILLTVAAVLAAGASSVAAQQEKSCLECHENFAKQLSGKIQHEPFDEGNCESCHVFHGFRNRAELAGPVFDVCVECHLDIVELPEEDLHAPLLDDDACVACHSPHASEYESLLLAESGTLCIDCHDGPESADGILHPPFAELACIQCHSPHGSLFGIQFTMPIGYLCVGCHGEILAGEDPSVMHAADGLDSCNLCHLGHSSAAGKLLRDEPPALCGNCHDVGPDDLAPSHAGLTPVGCVSCHDPHSTGAPALLRQVIHPPFEDRDCDICHDGPFDLEQLRSEELCLGCHDSPMGQASHTEEAMSAKSCVRCHSPHSSRREYLLLDEF